MGRGTYHLRSFEAWDSVDHALAQCLGIFPAILFVELGRDYPQLLNVAGNAKPVYLLPLVWVVLAIDAEVCVVLAFDQPVSALVTVQTPWLHGQRDVCVQSILGRARLVCLSDHGLDLLVLVEAPYRESVEEGDLAQRSDTEDIKLLCYLRAPSRSWLGSRDRH